MSSFAKEIATLGSWVEARAMKSLYPSRYFTRYEVLLRDLLTGVGPDVDLLDLTDPMEAAVEIEALCAYRSIQLYREKRIENLYVAITAEPERKPGAAKVDARTLRNRDDKGRFIKEPVPA